MTPLRGSSNLSAICAASWTRFRTQLGQNDLVALFQGDNRLFPVSGLAGLFGALTTVFASNVQRVHLDDFDLEQLLNGLANLRFVCARVSHNRVLVEVLALAGAFFGQPNRLNNFESVHRSRPRPRSLGSVY